jgi:hypothetical protein
MPKNLLIALLALAFNAQAAVEHKVKDSEYVITILDQYNYPLNTEQDRAYWLSEMMRLNKGKFIWGEIDLIRPGSVLTLPEHPNKPPIVTAEFEQRKAIGELTVESGTVTIRSPQANAQTVSDTATLYQGDSISSSAHSLSKISMIDKARFELGANSKIVFERYQFEPRASTGSATLTRFYHGVLRATTGLIGKLSPKNFEVRTPVVTVGIRGTDYIVRHCEGDRCGDYTGSSLAVIDGGIAAQSRAGSVDVNKGEFVGVAPSGELSEVSAIPAGFLDMNNDITQLESPLSWWQQLINRVQTMIE